MLQKSVIVGGALLVLALVASPLQGQATPEPSEIEALQAQLQEVLRNQRQLMDSNTELRRSNAELQRQLNEVGTQQHLLRSENEQLRDQVENIEEAGLDDQLEASINALLQDEGAAMTGVQSAAQKVLMTGEFRFRMGVANGADPINILPVDELDGWWVDSRVRVGFGYEFVENVRAYMEFQSHWAFGDGSSSNSTSTLIPGLWMPGETTTDVDLYQAWLELGDMFGVSELSTRIGRQEFVKGRQFIFGNAQFFNGISLDGMRVDWDSEDVTVTGAWFKLTSNDADVNQFISAFTTHDNDELYTLYFTLKSIENHELDLYWVYVNGHGGASFGSGSSVGGLGFPLGGAGLALGSTAYYHTMGARLSGLFPDVVGGLDYNIEAAFQFGNVNGSPLGTNDVKGYAIDATVGLTVMKEAFLRPFVRFVYLSGPDGDDSGWVPLYYSRTSTAPGTSLDFLYGVNGLLPAVNVMSLQVGVSMFLSPQWAVGVLGTYAWADEKIRSGDSAYGWEIDVGATYFHSKNLRFDAAVSIIDPDDQFTNIVPIEQETIVAVILSARLNF